ncbi:hypothetical protein CXB51_010859 [Gossypium anomalum]|uniref:Transcription elongation factor SPT5 n=1 Tax=Gossypium anomalum TaxID=47600 RepID=A0A8J5Z1S1_9ROSI|nr:hypothetical protein CXB51_010859 [Gossypium anomalum]
MSRGRGVEDDDIEDEEYEDEDHFLDEDIGRRCCTSSKKRRRSNFIDDVAEEDDEEDDDELYSGGGKKHSKAPRVASQFFYLEAQVDSDEEVEEDEREDDFIVETGADLPDDDVGRRMHSHPLLLREDEHKKMLKLLREAFRLEYDEETIDVEQQALLPSVRYPKLWMVKCATGRERETVACLMQKYIDKGSELQIRSVIALDHLKNYIYIEADKNAHVREAVKDMLVPIREMTVVLSAESKAVHLSRDTWVKMKVGTYKGDLTQVIDVDNVRQRVTVKLIPRIDLQELANKLEGREVAKKKAFVPPPRFMNVDEARALHIRVECRRNSISEGEIVGLSTLFANRKKTHFMKGDAVIVVKGDLKILKGWVKKVEEENVHIRPEMKGLPKTLAVNEKELCKYFEPGNHVKVVSGTKKGGTGMVVKVEQHVLIILSDTTKEHIRFFADDVVESSEVATGVTKIGDYELHNLVLLDNNSFGVIIGVENEAFQVLKGVPERPEVFLVKLREIKCKLHKKFNLQDRYRNPVSVKDVVRILEGPCKGKQCPVEHIYKGVVFVYDRHHLENAGFICVKADSCCIVGGSRSNGNRNGDSFSRFSSFKTPPRVPPSPRIFARGGPPFDSGGRHKGGRGGRDALIATTLESQIKVVTIDRNFISDNIIILTLTYDTSRYGIESETPMHPSRTPLHPYMTPMRDPGATPIHDGMRTPMRDKAWNPYAPISPPKDNREEGNPILNDI